MVAINGVGFDWSYMADDEAPTNIAFMDFLDSEVYTDNTCSKTCLKNYATLKTQYDELRVEFNKFKCNLADYKKGLASAEEQLVHYKTNESLLNENIVVLKRDILIKDFEIAVLKSKLQKISKEKDVLETKIEKFENASQSLDKLIGSQITDNSKRGLGYKPQGSEDFHQIVDFLNASYIRTLDNGEIELNATVDGQVKTITEASVRRHLKLADADGISTLPTTKIVEQLALMGYGEGLTSPVGTQHTPTVIATSPQLQNISIIYRKTRTKTRRISIRIPQSNVPTCVADEAITKEMHDGLGRVTTTASSLEAEQGSDKVTTIENELTSTKAVYKMALITLTKRVKKLEKKLKQKRRRTIIVSSEDEEASLNHEDSPKQGRMIKEINENENVNLTDDDETHAETLLNIKRSASKDKGKAIMQESEPPKKTKKKEMIVHRQRKKMLAAKRDEEKINKPPTQARQRTYMSNYIKNMRGYTLKQLKQYSFEEIKMLFDNTMESIRKFVPMGSEGQVANSKAEERSSKEGESLKRHAKEELEHEQEDEEEIVQQEDGDMKIMFEPDCDDEVWKNHHSQELIEWKHYDSCGVHSLMLGEVSIRMLVEKKYPLPQDTLRRMFQWKLHVTVEFVVETSLDCFDYFDLRLRSSTINVVFRCVSYFGDVTEWYQSTGYSEL
nr:hypothetical protein [Tanacetum cinerariifolium]